MFSVIWFYLRCVGESKKLPSKPNARGIKAERSLVAKRWAIEP